jgi:general secretion pathway protein K
VNKISSHCQQKGIALVVVLLIVAIISVIAVEMSGRLQINVARTLNLKANNQAFWYALGAEQFAKNSLSTLKTLTGDNINLSQPWAETFEFPVEGGLIKAQLLDMQACFNLNAINSTFDSNENNRNQGTNGGNADTFRQAKNTNEEQNRRQEQQGPTLSQQAFHRLIENFIKDSLVADTIRDSLIDWIDEDSSPNNYGAEDADYQSLPNPYLAANSPLSHPSEMRLVNGIDRAIQMGGLDDLRKVVCVLPEARLKINVNTITEENAVVLSALLGDTLDAGKSIIGSRPAEGFKSVEDFFNLSEVQTLELNPEQKQWFDVTTKYFKLNTTAKYQGSQFKLSTIFRLDDGGITIISREFGGAF